MSPARQQGKLQSIPQKAVASVRALRRKRVMSLSAEERKQICWLYDHSHGDADYVVERVNFAVLQRADVLAVVLADTRSRLMPERSGSGLAMLGAVA